MSAKVFLSCGQNKAIHEEIETANAIQKHLQEDFGMNVFVATEENFFEGNSSIFDNLKDSDYYIFINFERKVRLFHRQEDCFFSLYTHQELAMAFAYGFDESNMLVFHKKGMRRTGILAGMVVNGEFNDYSDVADVVIRKVHDKHWNSNYSRNLVLSSLQSNLHIGDRNDLFGNNQHFQEQITIINILNRRKDCAAVNCQVHLKRIVEYDNQQMTLRDNIDRNPVKASGVDGYSHTIGPDETVSFDLFVYDCLRKQLFMHTKSDVITPHGCHKPLIARKGEYVLTFEAYAEHFPLLSFDIKVHLGDDVEGGIQFSLIENGQEL